MTTFKTSATTLCALAAVLALGACQRDDSERTAGERMDTAVASAEKKAAEMKDDVKREGTEAGAAVNRATDAAATKVKDASITTAINAELARDAELSALRINVDTAEGRVVLRGTAPNAAARERAESLAKSVSGVMGVDNQLIVGTSG